MYLTKRPTSEPDLLYFMPTTLDKLHCIHEDAPGRRLWHRPSAVSGQTKAQTVQDQEKYRPEKVQRRQHTN